MSWARQLASTPYLPVAQIHGLLVDKEIGANTIILH